MSPRFTVGVILAGVLAAFAIAWLADTRASELVLAPIVWGSALGALIPLSLLLLVGSRQGARWKGHAPAECERQTQNDATAEALRAMARVEGEMLGAVSHELREPLSLVHGYAELLANRPRAFGPEEVRQIASEINRGSRLMSRLVDDLLDFNRVGRGTLRLEPTVIDLVAVVTNTIEIFAPRHGFDRLVVEAPRPVIVVGDAQRLSQVTANLISNALRYAPSDLVRVRVSLEPDGRALLEVKDHGPGISPGALPHLWDMFYRAPEAIDSPVAGSGIGLALVKHMVEAHGGSVAVESRPGEGATFRIYLPGRPARDRDSSAMAGPDAMPGQGASDLVRIAERIASAGRESSETISPPHVL
ncbi:MAG: sensor histidine kinase [Chloroflexota bacterium]